MQNLQEQATATHTDLVDIATNLIEVKKAPVHHA